MELSPNTASVTPWRMPLCERPSAISAVSEWFNISMNPGATARPVASTSCRPRVPPSSPRAAMRSPRIATSSTTPGDPLPSYTVPWRITTSYCGVPAHAADRHATRSRSFFMRDWALYLVWHSPTLSSFRCATVLEHEAFRAGGDDRRDCARRIVRSASRIRSNHFRPVRPVDAQPGVERVSP